MVQIESDRLHSARRDYTKAIIKAVRQQAPASQPVDPNPPKKTEKWLKIVLVNLGRFLVLATIITGGILSWHYIKDRSIPIPENIRQSVNFPLYYPSKLPTGYVFKKNSAKTDNNIIFYTLRGSSDEISISEQSVPIHPPDLKSLPGFNNFSSPAGTVAVGTVNGSPVAILLTDHSLVTIAGSKNTSIDTVTKLAESMASL